jgi:hypothetical protein
VRSEAVANGSVCTQWSLEPKYGGGKIPNYISLPGEVRLRKKVGTFLSVCQIAANHAYANVVEA